VYSFVVHDAPQDRYQIDHAVISPIAISHKEKFTPPVMQLIEALLSAIMQPETQHTNNNPKTAK
jgi:hypothetical protein